MCAYNIIYVYAAREVIRVGRVLHVTTNYRVYTECITVREIYFFQKLLPLVIYSFICVRTAEDNDDETICKQFTI